MVKRRSGEAYNEVRQITGEILKAAQQVAAEVKQVIKNAKQNLYRRKDGLAPKAQQVVQSLVQAVFQEKLVKPFLKRGLNKMTN
ncbi:MAG: hypothetical protein NUV48_13900 [Peptococcaceae bacterium]|nr:hypothetical protein [Peptococcaceae bacterium]